LSYLFCLKLNGIPNGVDSGAHLFRVVYLYENLKKGVVPLWNNLWYAGSPFLLLYGPLAFYIAMPFAFLVGPISAYKIVEILFFLLSIFSVYFFAKKVTKNKKVSFFAAFFFAISPFIIFNFSVVDRYATIVELFFFINSLQLLFSLYSKPSRKTAFCLGLFSALTFLSQGFGVIILFILFLTFFIIKQSFLFFKQLILVLFILFLVSSSWLLLAFPNFLFNLFHPFTNIWATRKYFDIARIGGTLFMLGLPVLTLILLKFNFFRKNKTLLIFSILLLAILTKLFYQTKYNLTYPIFLISSILTILFIFLNKFEFDLNTELKLIFLLSILFIFLASFLPLYSFTLLQVIDPYRVAVFAVIPMSIFAAYTLQKNKVGILLLTISFLLISSVLLTTVWPFGIEIDKNLIEKLKIAPEGRIIAPEPPTWIHMLPALTGKGSIDGLSPYERYLPELRKLKNQHFGLWFDDVTIEQRNKIYSSFITNSEKYGIKYIIFTKESKFVMPNVNYTLLYSSKEFDVYMLNNEVNFIEGGKMERPNPNMMIVYPSEENVLIKEAFAPGWKTSCGTISPNLDGFILLSGDCKEMVLTYKPTIFDVQSILWYE